MKILVAGDFCPTERLKPIVESGDYHSIFCEVEPIIKSADYSIVNYECPAVLGNYPPIEKCGPNLSSSPKGIEAIKYAGFNIATLANNHIMDFGVPGLMDTVSLCSQYNIDAVGVGKNLEGASKILYKRKDGETLAIINCCEHEFSIAGNDSAGANPLNPIQQYYKIKEAKQNAGYVLVIVHGGTEHYNLPTPRMKETYRFFIDIGADVVVNHHQHCYSGYELYNGKYIFYGLGNFCFDKGEQKCNFWNEGYVLKLNFNDSIDFEMIPYIQCAENPTIDFNVDINAFNNKVKELNTLITNDTLLKKSFNNMIELKGNGYFNSLQPYCNKYLKALYSKGLLPSFFSVFWYRYILAIFRCEAHRDIILHALESKLKK